MQPRPGAPTKRCPSCYTLCALSADTCHQCNAEFRGPGWQGPTAQRELRPGEVDDANHAIQTLIAAAEQPADTTGQPSSFRPVTVVMTAIVVLSLAMVPLGEGARALGVVLGVLFGTIWLVVFFGDLFFPGPRGRRDPRKAMKCYFKGVQQGRWKVVHACLAPFARNKNIATPTVAALDAISTPAQMSSVAGVKAYWKSLIRNSHGKTRRLYQYRFHPLGGDERIHYYQVELNIDSYPSVIVLGILVGVLPLLILYMLTRKPVKRTFHVVVIKHRSQWWLVSGEYDSPLDAQLVAAWRGQSAGAGGPATQ